MIPQRIQDKKIDSVIIEKFILDMKVTVHLWRKYGNKQTNVIVYQHIKYKN